MLLPVVRIRLTEEETDGDVGGVDGEDDGVAGVVVDGDQRLGLAKGGDDVELGRALLRAEFVGCVLPSELDEM
ncbi:hypothetical protein DXG03_004130, partial [Asterophora parasitica]